MGRYFDLVYMDCKKKITSFRFVTSVLLIIALVCAESVGVDQLIQDLGVKINMWIPPFYFDEVSFATFYGLIICYLFSDVPFMNRRELWIFHRLQRTKWITCKVLSLCCIGFVMTFITYFCIIIYYLPYLKLDSQWGEVISTCVFSMAQYNYNIIGITSSEIVTHFSPVQAMLTNYLMVWLVSCAIGLFMFCISIYINRDVAYVLIGGMALLNLSQGNFITIRWLKYVVPFSWYRLSLYHKAIFVNMYYPGLMTYVIICLIVIAVSLIMIYVRVQHTQFCWSREG